MIDLETAKRPEFVKAYHSLQSEIKSLKQQLKQYTGEESDDEKEKEFQKFLAMYGKKSNQKQARGLWFRLSKKKISKIWTNLPGYVKETPDKNYRVTPDKYLRNEKFDDVLETFQELNRPQAGARALNPMDGKLKELAAIRESRNGDDVSDMISRMKNTKIGG